MFTLIVSYFLILDISKIWLVILLCIEHSSISLLPLTGAEEECQGPSSIQKRSVFSHDKISIWYIVKANLKKRKSQVCLLYNCLCNIVHPSKSTINFPSCQIKLLPCSVKFNLMSACQAQQLYIFWSSVVIARLRHCLGSSHVTFKK